MGQVLAQDCAARYRVGIQGAPFFRVSVADGAARDVAFDGTVTKRHVDTFSGARGQNRSGAPFA